VETLDSAVASYLGIDESAYRALDILDQDGPMTAGRLAERARLSPGAVAALLDRLESKGLARRTRDTLAPAGDAEGSGVHRQVELPRGEQPTRRGPRLRRERLATLCNRRGARRPLRRP
jgi:DNA-binding IclR family transcriptional regulator